MSQLAAGAIGLFALFIAHQADKGELFMLAMIYIAVLEHKFRTINQ